MSRDPSVTDKTATALRHLAASHGVQPFYRDVEQNRRTASPQALLGALRALGEPVETPGDAPQALQARRRALARRLVEPVCVAREGQGDATVRLQVAAADGSQVQARLELEEGRTLTWRRALDRLPRVGRCEVAGTTYTAHRLPLPRELPVGYHRLTVSMAGGTARRSGDSLLVVAPPKVYDGGAAAERRDWGVFLPLYALRREETHAGAPQDAGPADLGVGDFTGLEELGRWVGGLGGTAVATLPLLAAFLRDEGDEPFEYSPYGPASRLFWNELFVDPRRLPELERSAEARRILASDDFRAEAEKLAAADLVDYAAAAALKRRVLEPLAAAFFADDAPEGRRAALEALRERRPELDDYAAFRAAGEHHHAAWQDWPPVARDGRLGPRDYDEAVLHYHLYAQLAAQEQVAAAAETLAASGGLYLDLPLGVHPSSFDVWRQRELFATGASTGAPPDLLFTGGQDWGFHPIHPERQRESGYEHFTAVLRNHMAHAGMLRIDHVMQLHRLFWIPRGVDKSEGLYVRYAARELYAILCIESHRHRCRVVGENLGTVPRSVNRALSRHGILKTFVLPFEVDGSFPRGRLHRPVARDEVASVNTHDMPMFHAYWRGADVEHRRELGWMDDEAAAEQLAERRETRRTWVRGLSRSGHLRFADVEDGEADPGRVLRAGLASLAESDAPLVLVNLEDLWGETEPQNVPGTWRQRPNWRGRADLTLAGMAQDPRVVETLERLDALRRHEEAPPAGVARAVGAGAAGPAAVEEEAAPPEPTTDAADMRPVAQRHSLLSDDDLYLFNEGRHFRLHDKLGAHRRELEGVEGYNFAVWAPDAETVSVIGDFNGWNRDAHPLSPRGASGVWEGFLPGARPGQNYKFHVRSRHGGYRVDKADPFAARSEIPPKTGSVLWHRDYEWGDGEWMERRAAGARGASADRHAPVSVYELHLGSWRRVPEKGDRPLTYREMAEPLADHVTRHGFTHVELLPVMEHPFYGSWGYQSTGYFAPTARYGTPQDFMYLVDHLHQRGIGVILDWVPSHFPSDEHGLGYFDGTHLFEHADPRLGFHPDWSSFIFNYARHEVRSFLISSALHWLHHYHADGLRVDAVASMLYRDYSREEGDWIPNVHGGRENLEAIDLLRQLNEAVYQHFPGAETFAEESTAWPGVSRPTYVGGLGFGYKWDMGWMHDTLKYMQREPVHRKFHQDQLTFRMIYAWSENYTLPLSHDEVVHGKGSLLAKMPGDDWQKFANLRLLYGYMWAQPAKKLLFMGGEIGQWAEWSHERSLDWHLLEQAPHRGISRWVADLNRVYRTEPALHELDCEPQGFEWVDTSDREASVLSFLRKGKGGDDLLLAVFNFTPVVRDGYAVGVPRGGRWQELLNSDAETYGGSGQGNLGGAEAVPGEVHGRSHHVKLTLPPLGMVLLKGPGRAG